jgi:dienelactone hydrolase
VGGRVGRRAVLLGAAGVAATVGIGGLAVASGTVPLPGALRRRLEDQGPPGVIPDVPEGDVHVEARRSRARGRDVGFFTAVPAGHGAGRGLPVCLVLHGASATTADFRRFGLPRFLTAATRAGVPPFVLAGADGGRSRWEGDGGADDPMRMLTDEVLPWCSARGFDVARVAAYGWSMGGYGVLRLAEERPGMLRAAAALSPAVSTGDAVFDDVGRLDGRRTALWCGRSDGLYPAVRALAARVPGGPAIAGWGPGAHTRAFWDRVTPDLLRFVGTALGRA